MNIYRLRRNRKAFGGFPVYICRRPDEIDENQNPTAAFNIKCRMSVASPFGLCSGMMPNWRKMFCNLSIAKLSLP
jgi:hypothetical protein